VKFHYHHLRYLSWRSQSRKRKNLYKSASICRICGKKKNLRLKEESAVKKESEVKRRICGKKEKSA